MKNIFYLSIIALLWIQCTPKMAEKEYSTKVTPSPAIEAFRTTVPPAGPPPEIKIGDYHVTELKNGLKVIVVENNKIPQVSYQLFVDRPAITEGDNKGYIELTGSLLSRGTTTKKKAEIDEEIDFMGASFETNKNGFFASSLTKYTDDLLAIASDALLHPSFPQDEFKKLVKQKMSELASNKAEAGVIAKNVASVLNFGKNHPYGEITTEKTISDATVDMCKTFYDTYFKPNISYLVVVGNITSEEAVKKAEKYFGSWERGNVPQVRYAKINPIEHTTIDFVNKPGAVQSEIKVTYPIDLRSGTDETINAQITNTILGGYFRSRLNQNLREDHGYTYGIYSGIRPDPLKGYFATKGSVRNEVTDSSIVEIIKEMNSLKSGNITEKELTTVKNVMSGKFGRNLERPEALARFALNTIKYNLPKDYYHNYLKKLNSATVEDIKMSAQKFIRPDKAHIVVVGNKDEVLDDLKALDSIGSIKMYDTYGTPIKERPAKELPALGDVLSKHFEALGGLNNLKSVKTLFKDSKATMNEMEMEMVSNYVNGEKLNFSLMMMGGKMQEIIFNKNKGVTIAQGQSMPMSEAEVKGMILESTIFPMMALKNESVKGKLLSIEPVDGKDAFMIQVKHDEDNSTTYFMDTKSFMIVKVMEGQKENGKTTFSNVYYSNYKLVDNVLLPYTTTVEAPGGRSLDFKVTEYKINNKMDDSLFEIK